MHATLFRFTCLLFPCISVCIYGKSLANSSATIGLPSTREDIYPDGNFENDTASCKLETMPEELEATKFKIQTIMSSSDTNLVYIHIEIEDNSYENLKFNPELKDRITEWQYVNKNEKFLVQLPVDVDMVTFNILQDIGDESMLTIPMRAEDTNCTYTERTVHSLKHSLWKHFLSNFSEDYVLCNRNFTNKSLQIALYWITTIWVGYDLSCNTRYDQPVDIWDINIKPFVCFILALQYFWIYAFLKFTNEKSNFNYGLGDRPYSLKRIQQKFLYLRLYNSETKNDEKTSRQSCCECLWKPVLYCGKCFRNEIDSPTMRLTFLIYIIILLPVSLYRTIYRRHISDTEVHNYLTILKPSDPFCSLCERDEEAYACDVSIAIVSTILGLYIFIAAYDMLAGKICEIERRKDENDLVDVFRNCSSCCCDQCESISDRPTADNGGNQGEEVNEPLPDNGGNQGAGMNEPPPDNGGNQGAGMNEPLDNGGNQSAGMNEPPPDNGGNQGAEVNESPPDNGGNQGAEVNEPPPDNGGNQGATSSNRRGKLLQEMLWICL